MKWGLVPSWANEQKIGYRIINARRETISEKPSYRKSFSSKRCLVPTTGFYEWKMIGTKKTPFYIHPPKDQFFAFAGLYDEWGTGTDQLESFTIITTEPTVDLASIYDRMPVILDKNEEEVWLNPDNDPEVLKDILRTPYQGILNSYEITSIVNSPKNDSPDIFKRKTN